MKQFISTLHSVAAVGTVWSVHDTVPAKIISTFYDMLDDSGRQLDCARAAVTLRTTGMKDSIEPTISICSHWCLA